MARSTLGYFLLLLLAVPAPGLSADQFWLVWRPSTPDCRTDGQGSACRSPDLRTVPFRPENPFPLTRMFPPDGSASVQSQLSCSLAGAETQAAHRLEALPLSAQLSALRGLEGVSFDLRNLQPPPGHSARFGPDLQTAFESHLRAAGLQVVSPTDVEALPGRPRLQVFFSYTDPDGDCVYTYSVFATLTQTVVLTRAPDVKLEAGIWSKLVKPSVERPDDTEFDAILSVALDLVRDWRAANAQ